MKGYYTCGTNLDVRGNCGHKHRTLEAAEKCNDRDQAGCARQGGYSDRGVVYIDIADNCICNAYTGQDITTDRVYRFFF